MKDMIHMFLLTSMQTDYMLEELHLLSHQVQKAIRHAHNALGGNLYLFDIGLWLIGGEDVSGVWSSGLIYCIVQVVAKFSRNANKSRGAYI